MPTVYVSPVAALVLQLQACIVTTEMYGPESLMLYHPVLHRKSWPTPGLHHIIQRKGGVVILSKKGQWVQEGSRHGSESQETPSQLGLRGPWGWEGQCYFRLLTFPLLSVLLDRN